MLSLPAAPFLHLARRPDQGMLPLSPQGKIDIGDFHDFILKVVSGKVKSSNFLIADTIQGSGGRRAGGQGPAEQKG